MYVPICILCIMLAGARRRVMWLRRKITADVAVKSKKIIIRTLK